MVSAGAYPPHRAGFASLAQPRASRKRSLHPPRPAVRYTCLEPGRKLRCAGHGEGGPLVEARGIGGRTDGGTGQLRVLGARRSVSGEGGEGGEDVDYEPTRPLPRRSRRNTQDTRSRRSWQFRLALGIVKVAAVVIAVFLAMVVLLYAFTPSAGRATSLAAAQAAEHNIAYPGPPVPQYFAEALVATEDHRFYADPGVDPLALFRVAASWMTGHTDGGGSTLDQQLAKNLYTS